MGVVDSLIDIVGAFLGCAYLQIETVSAGNVNVGSGTIESAHGTLPVPGPAVANLAKGVPIFAKGPNTELTTPTGISILTVLTQDFRTLPAMTPRRIGYGAGTYNPKNWPNVLRVLLTDRSSGPMGSSDDIVEVQTNLDDMNPQIYEASNGPVVRCRSARCDVDPRDYETKPPWDPCDRPQFTNYCRRRDANPFP